MPRNHGSTELAEVRITKLHKRNRRMKKVLKDIGQGFSLAILIILCVSKLSADTTFIANEPPRAWVTPFIDIGFDAVETYTFEYRDTYYEIKKSGLYIGSGAQVYVKPFYCGIILSKFLPMKSEDTWVINSSLNFSLGSNFGLIFPREKSTIKTGFSLFRDLDDDFEFTMIIGNVGYTRKWGAMGSSINGGFMWLKELIDRGMMWQPRIKLEEALKFHTSIGVFVNTKYIKPYLRGGFTYQIWECEENSSEIIPEFEPFASIGLEISTSVPSLCEGSKVPYTRTYNYNYDGPVALKPNIYLYPEKEGVVYVKLLSQKGNFITESLPLYEDGWDINVNPNSKIDGVFDYLFYEGKLAGALETSNGWCVGSDLIWTFFATTLREYGFNDKEISDFLEYWQIHLPTSGFYLVSPLYTDKVEEEFALQIEPTPTSVLRVWFYIKSVDESVELNAPKIPVFERNGFVVTEWGVVLGE